MKNAMLYLALIFIPSIAFAQTHLNELILPTTMGGADPSCSNATADGDICIGDDAETIDDMFVGDDLTVTGLATIGETLGMTGDLTLSGGAGGLTFSGSASSIVVDDNDATALLIGSSGALNLITLNTGTATESVIVTGTTTVEAFKVDTGTATFDETVLVSGDLTLSGDAGALTFDSASASIVLMDNQATALDIGAAGATSMMRFVTTDSSEAITLTGIIGLTGATTITGATVITDLDNAVVVQGDAPASCTVGQWFWDTAGTIELCYCDVTNDLLCIDVTTNATDPKD